MTCIVRRLAATAFACLLLGAAFSPFAGATEKKQLVVIVTTVASLPTDDGARMLLSTGAQEVLVTSQNTFRVSYVLNSQAEVQAVIDEVRQQPGVVGIEAVEESQLSPPAPATTAETAQSTAPPNPTPPGPSVNWLAVGAAAILTTSGTMVLWRSRRRT